MSETKELKALYEIARILNESHSLDGLFQRAMDVLSQELGVKRGSLTIYNKQDGELVIEAATGLKPSEMKKGRYKPGEGVTGMVFKTGRPAIIPSVGKEPLFLDKTGARKGLRKEEISFICVPIRLKNEVLGTISVDRIFGEGVNLEEDVRVLTVVASMIAHTVKRHQEIREEREKLIEENLKLRMELKDNLNNFLMVGKSRAMREVFSQIQQVASSNATVLIRGESGTGKGLVAKAIHYNSSRAHGPFIVVNCAALPEALIESELFGYEKGAFTGAYTQKKGKFELADGGTIFLDEIGDLPPSLQAKLLRVLQDREFERLGGDETIRVDVRIIAATNQDLEKKIMEGSFREDLYYRLNVFPIYLPPLRERKEDIPLLVDYFVEKYSREHKKTVKRVSTPVLDVLMSYHWPGNVRELENVIERAVILSTDGVIRGYHLPPSLQTSVSSNTSFKGTLDFLVSNLEKELIVEALKESKGNKSKAARRLGTTLRILDYKIRKYGIDVKRFK